LSGQALDDKTEYENLVKADLERINMHLGMARSRASTPGGTARRASHVDGIDEMQRYSAEQYQLLASQQHAQAQAEAMHAEQHGGDEDRSAGIGIAANWEERMWHDGRVYYLNRMSREKQWNRPKEEVLTPSLHLSALASVSPLCLPVCSLDQVVPCSTPWIQRQDAQTGRYYYYNHENKMTQWKVHRKPWPRTPNRLAITVHACS